MEQNEKSVACTFICSKDTYDGVIPPLILSINARRLGMEATVFFTFMGVNVILKGGIKRCKFIPPGPMGAIPGMAMVATKMMKKKMEKAGIPFPEELLEMALLEGVKFVACKMTVDMMGLSEKDFIEGVSIQTAEEYIKYASQCQINMFI